MQKILLSVAFGLFFNLNLIATTGTSYTAKRDRVTGVQHGKSPYVGVFSDLMTAQRNDTINVQFQYNVPVDLIETDIENGGTVEHDTVSTSMVKLSTGADTNGLAVIRSKTLLRYIPGHEAYAYFTAVFTKGVANSIQWAGTFDDSNGFGVGYNGTDFSILYRRGISGAVNEDTISQSNFNIDTLDGKGPSGIYLDPTKINIFRVSFGWLGTAPITLQICRKDGTWFAFHKIQRANEFTVPSIYNPVLPIRMEARNSGNTSDVIMYSASWCGGILGRTNSHRQHMVSKTDFTISTTSDAPVIAFRNEGLFEGKANKIDMHLVRAYFAATSTDSFKTSGKLIRFRFYKSSEGMVSGGTWVDYDSSPSNKTSSVKYNITATGFSGGEEVFFVPLASRESREVLFGGGDADHGVLIGVDPGEEILITAAISNLTGENPSGDLSVIWHESIS